MIEKRSMRGTMGELLLDVFIPPHPDETLGDDSKNQTENRDDEGVHSSLTSIPDVYEPQALSDISVPVKEDDDRIGVMIGGKYRIERKIGQGGMGVVYLGINDDLGQRVAIKFLSRKFIDDEGIVHRFLNEARSYCRVNHPNAVTLLEYGQVDDGTLYIITEFVEGQNLADTVKSKGIFEFTTALAIGVQLCEVLAAAHEQGVIHRDLKPDNLMLMPTARGRYAIKVLDFGIAKIVDDEEFDSPTTETGSVFGTPEFMSPEQARGETADGRSDIYAVGIILFFMVTGKLPFKGKNKLVVLNKQLNEHPPRPSKYREDLPRKLEAVIMKCLNKSREARYASAYDLMEALEELQHGGLPSPSAERVGAEAAEVAAISLPTTPEPIRANTVRLGDFSGREDGHADTLASESNPRLAELESIELWREQPTSETDVSSGGSPHVRAIAGIIAAIVIVAGIVAALSSSEDVSGGGEVDIGNVLVTGQVLGLLSAAEDMVRDGNLDGASKTLEQTDLWMTDGDLTRLAAERRASLREKVAALLEDRGALLVAADGGECARARSAHASLAAASPGLAKSLEAELARACAPKGTTRKVQAPSATKPAIVREPVEEAVSPPPVVIVPPDAPSEDSAPDQADPPSEPVSADADELPSANAADDAEKTPDPEGTGEADANLGDGMALPPKVVAD